MDTWLAELENSKATSICISSSPAQSRATLISSKIFSFPQSFLSDVSVSRNITNPTAEKVEEPELLRGEILDTFKCFSSKPDGDPYEDTKGPKGFLDSHKENALWAADHFCETQAKKYDGAKAPIGLVSHTYDTRHALGQGNDLTAIFGSPKPDMMDHWQVNVTDTETCNLGLVEERYMERPTGQYDCKALLFATWRQCDNKGRGGSVEAGCMRFSMHPLW